MPASRFLAVLLVLASGSPAAAQSRRLESADYLKLKSVGAAQISPDGARVAYTVVVNHVPRRPLEELWVMALDTGQSLRIAAGSEDAGAPEWSPDARWLAYIATAAGKTSPQGLRPRSRNFTLAGSRISKLAVAH